MKISASRHSAPKTSPTDTPLAAAAKLTFPAPQHHEVRNNSHSLPGASIDPASIVTPFQQTTSIANETERCRKLRERDIKPKESQGRRHSTLPGLARRPEAGQLGSGQSLAKVDVRKREGKMSDLQMMWRKHIVVDNASRKKVHLAMAREQYQSKSEIRCERMANGTACMNSGARRK
jgi:hypothetical protein